QTASLTGTGLLPTASVSPSSLTFASQPIDLSSAPLAVTLSNSGTLALSIALIAVSAGSSDFSQSNNCGNSLAPSSICTIKVTFTPSALGTRSGTLTITDNLGGVAGSMQTVALSGTGTGPAPIVSLSSASLALSTVAGVTSPAQSVTVTNSGSASLTFSSIT